MATKSTSEVWNDIIGVTGPLEKTLKALAENPNGTEAGRKQAGENQAVINEFHEKGKLTLEAALAQQHSHAQSMGMGMTRGRANSSSDNSDNSDKRDK